MIRAQAETAINPQTSATGGSGILQLPARIEAPPEYSYGCGYVIRRPSRNSFHLDRSICRRFVNELMQLMLRMHKMQSLRSVPKELRNQ